MYPSPYGESKEFRMSVCSFPPQSPSSVQYPYIQQKEKLALVHAPPRFTVFLPACVATAVRIPTIMVHDQRDICMVREVDTTRSRSLPAV